MSIIKTNKQYKATFILDLRETSDDAPKVLDELVKILKDLGATIEGSENLGVSDFARVADRNYSQGHYLEIYFTGASSISKELKDKLRLDKKINRIFVEIE